MLRKIGEQCDKTRSRSSEFRPALDGPILTDHGTLVGTACFLKRLDCSDSLPSFSVVTSTLLARLLRRYLRTTDKVCGNVPVLNSNNCVPVVTSALAAVSVSTLRSAMAGL